MSPLANCGMTDLHNRRMVLYLIHATFAVLKLSINYVALYIEKSTHSIVDAPEKVIILLTKVASPVGR